MAVPTGEVVIMKVLWRMSQILSDAWAAVVLCVMVLTVSPVDVVAQSLDVGEVTGQRGWAVTFNVSISTGGAGVVATENHIAFDSVNTPIGVRANGTPDCTVNPALGRGGTFAFLPSGCVGTNCADIQAVVIDPSNMNPIPNGVLYSCNLTIAPDAPVGTYALTTSNEEGSDSEGNPVPMNGLDGSVTVTSGGGGGC
jgi:hypothetical protein